ncbi:hypothetical protein [Holdemania massiliensis]|uniref:hypothetical protein n=1 Tax=Holdemania massiliensis TaxID=1468449 RepID=UPI00242B6F79|nr:hypothetical protein [Holdemania massiliensis]
MKKLKNIFAVIFVAILMTGCSEKKELFKTSGDWSLPDTPYVFAVEWLDFDGDIYKAGTYEFELRAGRFTKEETPIVFEIYKTEKKEIKDPSELIYLGSVGGVDAIPIEVDLERGNFVIIYPLEVVGTPSGYLHFERKKD